MDIQLKQSEIDKAVRLWITENLRMDLTGKRLGVQFSMTRTQGGLVANLTIEDANEKEIPGFTDREADPEPPKAAVAGTIGAAIQNITPTIIPAAAIQVEPDTTGDDPALSEPSAPEAVEVAAEVVDTPAAAETKPAATGASLFG